MTRLLWETLRLQLGNLWLRLVNRWLRLVVAWLRLQVAWSKWRLRRHGIDPDTMPELEDVRRRREELQRKRKE